MFRCLKVKPTNRKELASMSPFQVRLVDSGSPDLLVDPIAKTRHTGTSSELWAPKNPKRKRSRAEFAIGRYNSACVRPPTGNVVQGVAYATMHTLLATPASVERTPGIMSGVECNDYEQGSRVATEYGVLQECCGVGCTRSDTLRELTESCRPFVFIGNLLVTLPHFSPGT
jgi:hypothetical protein